MQWADGSHPMDRFRYAQMHAKGLGTHLTLEQMGAYFVRGECCDVVKIDVEGDEFAAFLDGPSAAANLRFLQERAGQLLIELHFDVGAGASVSKMRRLTRAFDAIGLRAFSNETNVHTRASCAEVSYLNVPRLIRRGGANLSFMTSTNDPRGSSPALALGRADLLLL